MKKYTHAVVVAYNHEHLGDRGTIVSRHKSHALAEKAAKKSGYDSFLCIKEIHTDEDGVETLDNW